MSSRVKNLTASQLHDLMTSAVDRRMNEHFTPILQAARSSLADELDDRMRETCKEEIREFFKALLKEGYIEPQEPQENVTESGIILPRGYGA